MKFHRASSRPASREDGLPFKQATKQLEGSPAEDAFLAWKADAQGEASLDDW